MALVIALAGGGTGGHVFPALALADAIRKRDPDAVVHFLGTERGVGADQVRAAGFGFDALPSRPVLGRGPVAVAVALGAIARGTWRARRVLRRADTRLVIGVGGYASVPGVLAAVTLRIPTVLIEADAEPGRANRLLARFARRVFVQFDAALERLPAGRGLRLGFPVRAIPRRVDAPDARLRVLVVGGSQGAHSINRALAGSAAALREAGVDLVHQTGERDCETVRAAYAEAGLDAEVGAFFDDLPERLARADLLVARAGASTIAELCQAGVAAILVPYPHAGGHQEHNARALERAGACVAMSDADVAGGLAPAIARLARDPARRRTLAAAAAGLAAPGAAERIWDACRPLALEADR